MAETAKERMAKVRAAKAAKQAQRASSGAVSRDAAAKAQLVNAEAPPPKANGVPVAVYGEAVRVLLPKARDPVQRTVTALVSEVDGGGSILAWCMPGRASTDFTVQVNHASQVTDPKLGWWEAVR